MPFASGDRRSGERALRVALDTSYSGTNPTGVGLYSRRLADELRRIAPTQGVDFRCYGPACGTAAERPRPLEIAQEWPAYTHGVLPMKLKRFGPDVVHATSHIGPLWGDGKLVVTVHDLIFLRRPEEYGRAWLTVTRLLLPRVLRRATCVACDSEATRKDVLALNGLRRAQTVVVYPGIDGQFAGVPARRRPLPYPYILCLGPWVKRKNLGVVVRAFARLARDHGDVRLVITGGPSPGVQSDIRTDLVALLPDELRHRLILPGFVERDALPALVAGASVLAYPSVDEGFGLPPLEAMAAAVPVVVADTPAVVEATGGAALVAPKEDFHAWAEQLSIVLERPEVAERCRAAGLRHSAHFTWDACASAFLAIYRRI
jgi:glycosyltransferase involved in cell wall biosynthesis